MATSAPCIDSEIVRQLADGVRGVREIDSVCFAHGESSFHVWVGITEDTLEAWRAVGKIEDRLSENYPEVPFEFHVIPLSGGRRLVDFVSTARQVFQRAA